MCLQLCQVLLFACEGGARVAVLVIEVSVVDEGVEGGSAGGDRGGGSSEGRVVEEQEGRLEGGLGAERAVTLREVA